MFFQGEFVVLNFVASGLNKWNVQHRLHIQHCGCRVTSVIYLALPVIICLMDTYIKHGRSMSFRPGINWEHVIYIVSLLASQRSHSDLIPLPVLRRPQPKPLLVGNMTNLDSYYTQFFMAAKTTDR